MNMKKFVLFVACFVLFGFINVYAEEPINEVSITIENEPAIGDKVSDINSGVSIPTDANYSIEELMWWESENGMFYGSMADDSVFQDNYCYTYSIALKPSSDYEFPVNENEEYTGSVSVTGVPYQDLWVDDDGFLNVLGDYIQFGDINYHVIEGADQTYTIGESTEASFTIDADYSYFDEDARVIVDEEQIDSNNYISSANSDNNTVVTLKKDYLDNVATGEHSLFVVFNNYKYAETTFNIAKSEVSTQNNTENNTKLEILPPNTGINYSNTDSNSFYITMLLLCILCIGGRIVISNNN